MSLRFQAQRGIQQQHGHIALPDGPLGTQSSIKFNILGDTGPLAKPSRIYQYYLLIGIVEHGIDRVPRRAGDARDYGAVLTKEGIAEQ